MGAHIYELCGRGLQGSWVMCHLVAIGAHDGRPGTGSYHLRKVKPNYQKQYKSWFNPAARDWIYEGHPVVGQIFFPFGGKGLDTSSDRIVLNAVIAWYRFELGQNVGVELEFVGHADPRGTASFNMKLGSSVPKWSSVMSTPEFAPTPPTESGCSNTSLRQPAGARQLAPVITLPTDTSISS
jgi:hypothetical protein